jgi:hypothetical protein
MRAKLHIMLAQHLSRQLAPDFASRLLEAELELENNCCFVVLQEVLDLYQEAVEFYERNDDPRYLDFQKRIHSVLVKPEVKNLLNTPHRFRRQDQARTLKDKKDKLERFKRSKTVLCEEELHQHKVIAEETVATVAWEASETVLMTKEGVRRQQSLLEQRRQARRDKRTTAEISRQDTEKSSPAFESDKSGGHARLPTAPEELESKLEALMERSFSEKSAKLMEIKLAYEAEMRKAVAEAVDSVQTELMVAQMKSMMEDELAVTAAQFDAKRRQDIRSLKAQLI